MYLQYPSAMCLNNVPFYFLNNYVKKSTDFNNFWYTKSLPSSPISCCCITLESAKSYCSTWFYSTFDETA